MDIHTKHSFDTLSAIYAGGYTTLRFSQRGVFLSLTEGDTVNIYEARRFGGKYWGTGTVVFVDTTIGKIYIDMD